MNHTLVELYWAADWPGVREWVKNRENGMDAIVGLLELASVLSMDGIEDLVDVLRADAVGV